MVVGVWSASPFGAFADVMVQTPDDDRVLLAPDERIADFVGSTYAFDRVELGAAGAADRRGDDDHRHAGVSRSLTPSQSRSTTAATRSSPEIASRVLIGPFVLTSIVTAVIAATAKSARTAALSQ